MFITSAHCTYPMVGPNVVVEGYTDGREGSQISYHCQFGLVPNELAISTCIQGGIWSPNPAKHICKGII